MPDNDVAFHLHSNHSDGGSTVAEVVEELVRNDVKIATICDHDEIGGNAEFQSRTEKAGIISIAGAEISTCCNGEFYVHILAYNLNIKQTALIEKGLRKNWQAHDDCFEETLEIINKKYNLHLTKDGIRSATNRSGNANFTLPLFKYLTEYLKYSSNEIRQSFFSGDNSPTKRLLRSGKLMTMEEGLDFITSIGATPVLAHPGLIGAYSLTGNGTVKRLEQMFAIMVDLGLKGAEYYYPYQENPGIKHYVTASKRLIEKYGLWKVSGSDYHGAYKTNACGIAMPGMSLAEALRFKAFCEK